MQKKLIAVAIAGLASTAAFAQSNVTVYGVADGTFDVIRASSSKAGASAVGDANTGNFTRVSSNSSYLGFKGAEALGNGLTAVFQFEGGVRTDGGSTGFNFDRDTFVGVGSGFGTVVLGQLTGPTRALGNALDVNVGATGIGDNQALLGKLGNYLVATTANDGTPTLGAACGKSGTCASLFDTRWKNTIAYVSPSFYGASFTGAYVTNENRTANNAAAKLSTSGYDIGLKYVNGPILAGLTYNAVSVGNNGVAALGATTNHTEVSDLRAGASYDFGIASIRGIFDKTKASNFSNGTIGGQGTSADQTVYGLGGTFNVTPAGKVIGQFYKAQSLKLNGTTQAQTGAKLYELGYEQSLSKRTVLKAVYAGIKNDDNAKYDFGVNASGAANGTGAAGYTVSGFQVGLRHNF